VTIVTTEKITAAEYRALGRLMRHARTEGYTYYVTTVCGATDWSWSKGSNYAVVAQPLDVGWKVTVDDGRAELRPASVQQLSDVLVAVGLLPGRFSSRANRMYEDAYFNVQSVLDKALGPDEEDGAGEGIAADVALLAEQRDEARAELEQLKAKLDMPCGHCHPCTNWAPQTWINAGRSIPPVHEYDAMVAELELRRTKAGAA
jgi:hypothetical protein